MLFSNHALLYKRTESHGSSKAPVFVDNNGISISVKNPGPEDQALISPQRGGVYRYIISGIMEWWKNGIWANKGG